MVLSQAVYKTSRGYCIHYNILYNSVIQLLKKLRAQDDFILITFTYASKLKVTVKMFNMLPKKHKNNLFFSQKYNRQNFFQYWK